jgi:riboflavin kinase/FMN adenylyltransferase
MLESSWFLCDVISGKGRGKILGFPTLNLLIPEKFSFQFGIFAGFVRWDNKTYQGAFHYGPIDTFNDARVSLEVFVLGAEIVNPPKIIEIKLAHFLRKPKKFDSSQELTQQITKDVALARELLAE